MANVEEKNMIGIAFAGRENSVGSVIGCALVVKPTIWREYGFLKIKQDVTRVELNKIVELTRRRIVHSSMQEITPEKLDNVAADVWEIQAIINMLNSIYRFWDHKISINTSLSREKFVELFQFYMPANLKLKQLDIDKWDLEAAPSNKLITLAGLYAQYQLNNMNSDIMAIWGDFRDPDAFVKLHPDCPHIRKSSQSYRHIWPETKSKEEEENGNHPGERREESKNTESHSL